MREELHDAYNHLQAIKEASYGLLSHDDLDAICCRYGLSKEDGSELVARLQNEEVVFRSTIEKNTLLDGFQKEYESETDTEPPVFTPANQIIPLSDEQLMEKASRIKCEENFVIE